MINKLTSWQSPAFGIGLALVILIVAGGVIGGIYLTQIPPEQPIDFPHNLHVGLGAQCIYCHSAAPYGTSAGLPTTDKCWACHQQINKSSPELDKLAGYARNNDPIPWVPVAIQPDHVHFNHQAHLAMNITCETCHGVISSMRVAEPQKGQNMGWCLDCHNTLAPEDSVRLSDCSLCHY